MMIRYFTNSRPTLIAVLFIRAGGSDDCNIAQVARGGVDLTMEMDIHAWDMASMYIIESFAAGIKEELTCAQTWVIDPVEDTTNFVHIASVLGSVRSEEFRNIVNHNIKYLATNGHGKIFNILPPTIRSGGSDDWNIAQVARSGVDLSMEMGIHAWNMASGYVIVR
ncbi:inositol monophosphatase 1-like [Aphis craccivora]|uniref:Inositol monophosphatase 1-like n=1 Tax=Aphis craccivora TaxID=307492 RepID=A0A6G0YEK0_APHCR|nr:inositol monophosphatase 1-like [Aphis craccivora]